MTKHFSRNTKLSRYVFFILFIFLVFCFFPLAAQNSAQPQGTLMEENAVQQNSSVNESDFSFDISDETETIKAPGTAGLIFRVIIVLALVVACIYAVFHFMKKSVNPAGITEDDYLKKVASLSVAPGKAVHVVTINRHAYVIGTAENSISLIAELNDDELVDAMNVNAEKKPDTSRKDFASMLQSRLGQFHDRLGKISAGSENKKQENE
jgi:flagellar protein FliO/FliZ